MNLRHDVTIGSDDAPFRLIGICMFGGSVDTYLGFLLPIAKMGQVIPY